MNVDGKRVIVTGGLGSLGAAVANHLKEKGAKVIIFDRTDSKSDDVYKVNLTDAKAVEAALDEIGDIDILINCAGEIYSEPILSVVSGQIHSMESWERIIDNNLTSSFVMGSRVASRMAAKRIKGVIINFSSISAAGNMGQIAYSSAKAGIEAMTKVMAKEFGMLKIRVNAIAPGFIETQSTQTALSDSMLDYWKKNTPLRKLGNIDDINKTIDYIIDTDYLSGAILHIDGGLTI